MKKIINGKLYNTETATLIGKAECDHPNEPYWSRDQLYRKRTGEFFLHGEGGPDSRYSQRIDFDRWSGGENIIPLTDDEARKWAEGNLGTYKYEKVFGEAEEENQARYRQLCVGMPSDIANALRKNAKEKNRSVSSVVTELVSKMLATESENASTN